MPHPQAGCTAADRRYRDRRLGSVSGQGLPLPAHPCARRHGVSPDRDPIPGDRALRPGRGPAANEHRHLPGDPPARIRCWKRRHHRRPGGARAEHRDESGPGLLRNHRNHPGGFDVIDQEDSGRDRSGRRFVRWRGDACGAESPVRQTADKERSDRVGRTNRFGRSLLLCPRPCGAGVGQG